MFITKLNKSSDYKISKKALYNFQGENTEIICEKPLEEIFSSSAQDNIHFNPDLSFISEFQEHYKITENQIVTSLSSEEDFFNSRKKNELNRDFLGQVVQNNAPQEIRGGDRLQLGLTTLYILEKNDRNSFESIIDKPKHVACQLPNGENPHKDTCRICFQTAEEADEPLVCPCDCSGSSQFIHVGCLKSWISVQISKTNIRPNAKFMIFNHKSIACDVCNQIYPWKIAFAGNEIDLLEFNRPESNYIIIEKIDPNNTRTVAMIRDFPEITIGRSLSANIILHDNTGSRSHAVIRILNGVYTIQDLNSKFGTIVEVKKSVNLKDNLALKFKHCIIQMKKKQAKSSGLLHICSSDSGSDDEEEEKKPRRTLRKSKKIKKILN